MCTSVAMQQGGGYFGRNMDIDYSFGQQVAVTPRRYPLRFLRQPAMERHYAFIGMAHGAGGRPLYAEAANEKGLRCGGPAPLRRGCQREGAVYGGAELPCQRLV